jgi:LmbE family N-acetylglucosaminyl deacetylase
MKSISFLVIVALCTFFSPGGALAQPDPLAPAGTGGLPAVESALAKLSTHQRLLMIAAHPDDEDTRLLTEIARGRGGEAAYLSLSRGDGGQNLIGLEMGIGLGLLRSRELEAARRVDHARQYFTRAYDFGFTRSLEETQRRWPEAALIDDSLRVIAEFKPQVLVAVFPPTPAAGHGQHQLSAVIAEKVFELAQDPKSFLDRGLEPWRIESLYRVAFFDPENATHEVPLDTVDPFAGRSMFQIALESRSQHRCQDMGQEQPLGAAVDQLIHLAGVGAGSADVFSAIDTRLGAMAVALVDAEERRRVETELEALAALAGAARRNAAPSRLGEATAPLLEILRRLRALHLSLAEAGTGSTTVRALIAEKIAIAEEATAAAAGIAADALAEREVVVPGENLKVRSQLWSAAGRKLEALEVGIVSPAGWQLLGSVPAEPAPGRFSTKLTDERRLEVAIPGTAPISVPYFLKRPLQGDLYQWAPGEDVATRPFESPPLFLSWRFSLEGVPLELRREVIFRSRDQALGEIRRPLRVLPPLEVMVAPATLVRLKGQSGHGPAVAKITLRSHQSDVIEGRLEVEAPWSIPPQDFKLPARGETILEVAIEPPATLPEGHFALTFAAVVGRERFNGALKLIDYPHVRPVHLPTPARLDLTHGTINLPAQKRIGYVRGASDQLPELLLAIGLPIEVLGPEDLARGNLAGYNTIVIGSRAYEVDQALVEHNARLIEYVEAGGRVIAQYQQYQFVRGKLAPKKLEIRSPHDRVTDEASEVRLLDPEHRVFRHPNVLSASDWQGWVQERGLYFAGTWDPSWQPLLALKDPDEDEQLGGLLVTQVGKGTYVYTGLAFFRQLPAGVIGAYRLFVNLLEI